MPGILVVLAICVVVIHLMDKLAIPPTPAQQAKAHRWTVLVILVAWVLFCLGVFNLPDCLRT